MYVKYRLLGLGAMGKKKFSDGMLMGEIKKELTRARFELARVSPEGYYLIIR